MCLHRSLIDFQSSLVTGNKSHKTVQSDVSRILKLYYDPVSDVHTSSCCETNSRYYKKLLFTICFGNELFFVALYLMKWVDTPLGYTLPIIGPLTWASALAMACAPICALKNVINVVQLWKASKILVGVDLAERAMARRAAMERQLAAANTTALPEKVALNVQSS